VVGSGQARQVCALCMLGRQVSRNQFCLCHLQVPQYQHQLVAKLEALPAGLPIAAPGSSRRRQAAPASQREEVLGGQGAAAGAGGAGSSSQVRGTGVPCTLRAVFVRPYTTHSDHVATRVPWPAVHLAGGCHLRFCKSNAVQLSCYLGASRMWNQIQGLDQAYAQPQKLGAVCTDAPGGSDVLFVPSQTRALFFVLLAPQGAAKCPPAATTAASGQPLKLGAMANSGAGSSSSAPGPRLQAPDPKDAGVVAGQLLHKGPWTRHHGRGALLGSSAAGGEVGGSTTLQGGMIVSVRESISPTPSCLQTAALVMHGTQSMRWQLVQVQRSTDSARRHMPCMPLAVCKSACMPQPPVQQ